MRIAEPPVPPAGPRRRAVLAAAAAAAALSLGAAAPAEAAEPSRGGGRPGRPDRLRVHAAADRLTADAASAAAGPLRLDVSADSADQQSIGILRLREDVALDAFLRDYRDATSTDPATAHRATRLIDAEAQYFGGATVTRATPLSCTVLLGPGSYLLFNYTAIHSADPAAHAVRLTVRRGGARRGLGRGGGGIVLAGSGPHSRFLMPDRLSGRGTYAVVNTTAQLNELTLMPVAPDATEAQVAAFWAAVQAGQQPPPGLVRGTPVGLAPLDPGRAALLTLGLPAGRYLAASYLSDRRTWVKGVFEGFWKLVDVEEDRP